MHGNFMALFARPWFWSAFAGWVVPQIIKMVVGFVRTRRLDFHYLVSTGGMPSAHSSMVCALATAVGLTEGFDKPLTMMAIVFASVTMFDAAVVRRAAGQQARVLNKMLDDIFKQHRISEKRLKELLGHTRLEVFMGLLTGVVCAIVVTACWRH
jgi:acid phosphatase family membrane protein YuiD